MNARPVLSLPEWTVLTVLSQQPAHGFAVAQLTARHGELGRIWQIPRPVIYRAISRLVKAGLVRPESVQPGLGPQRTIYAATPQGREAAERWLDTPVEHVRDIRSHLLLKFALLDRAGADPADLLRRQRAVLEPIAQAIEAGPPHAAVSMRSCWPGAGQRQRRRWNSWTASSSTNPSLGSGTADRSAPVRRSAP